MGTQVLKTLAVVAMLASVTASCGQEVAGDEARSAEPVAAAQGAPTACLSAALIAPPAWKGFNLSADSRQRIGARFVQLSDECLRGAPGSAPIECLRATQALELYRDPSRSATEIDAEYLRNWRLCVDR